MLFDKGTTFDVSDSPGALGVTGRFIVGVFEVLKLANPLIVRPVTEVSEPKE